MKKTGLEIVEMIAKGKAPKKIKINGTIYNFNKELNDYVFDNYGDLEKLNILCWLNEEFEIIEENKVWKPKDGEEYFYLNDVNMVIKETWNESSNVDRFRYEIGNCFRTEEETKKEIEKTIIKKKLERYALEHNTEKIDWNNFDQTKYYINYDFSFKMLRIISLNFSKDIGQVYFTSKGLAEQAIQEIGEDNIMKLFEEKQNESFY